MTSIPEGSIVKTRKDIFILMKDCLNSSLSVIVTEMEARLSLESGKSVEILSDLRRKLANLFNKMRSKYQKAQRKEAIFFKKNADWLQVEIAFQPRVTSSEENFGGTTACASAQKKGRPSSECSSLSDCSKRRRTDNLRKTFDADKSAYATGMSLRSGGQLQASKIVKEIPTNSSQDARQTPPTSHFLDSKQALSLFLDMELSRRKYQLMRNSAIAAGCKLYPPYASILKAKTDCYPPRNYIEVVESKVEIKLQALLDHTVSRIFLVQKNVFAALKEDSNMQLICKWGFDGTSGQSTYKIKFSDETISDATLLYTSLMPLKLICVNGNREVMWCNSRSSSTLFCRPLRLQFVRESPETSVNEAAYFENQIKQLVPYTTIISGREVTVSYELALTIVDGKVYNAVTSTKSSQQRCYLCNATSREFNNLDSILSRPVNIANLRHGMSTLYAWIWCFECCLDVSYHLKVKKWQARGAVDKKLKETRKAIIQKGFKNQLGLNVDIYKQGYGSSNNMNTARRFFENANTSAIITGLDKNFIHRFHVILQTISSGHDINLDKFRKYSLDTAYLFVQLYPWYYMPTSVHKLLVHGPEIVQNAILPIGILPEEVQEASNELIRKYRDDFSLKSSRVHTIKNVFLRLMATSDPYISTFRKERVKSYKTLSPDATALLTGLVSDTKIDASSSDDE